MKKTTIQLKKIRKQKPTRATERAPNSSRKPSATLAKPDQPPPTPKTTVDAWNERRDQRKAEHAAMIAEDPWKASQTAQAQLDDALELFSALIDKGALHYTLKSVDGTQDHSTDQAAQCLCSRISYMTRLVASFAHAGHPDFVASAWGAAKFLTELVHDLAFDKETAPVLERYARRSLFLPSLRARPATFTHDFQAVAETLHLSENCLCHMEGASTHKLDSPITHLVAEVVELIGWIQEHLRSGRELYTHSRKVHPDQRSKKPPSKGDSAFASRIDAMTEDEYLVSFQHCRPATLHYDKLPPLTKATADEWWIKAVRPEITLRFTTLEGTRVYALLNGNKPHEKLDDLRRRGKSALRSLSRPTPQDPHPS